MHRVIKETQNLKGETRMERSVCLMPVYFGNFFCGIENWWFNLIITLLVEREKTDLGFAFCSGVSPRQIC